MNPAVESRKGSKQSENGADETFALAESGASETCQKDVATEVQTFRDDHLDGGQLPTREWPTVILMSRKLFFICVAYLLLAITIVPAISDPLGTSYWKKFIPAMGFAVLFSIPVLAIGGFLYFGVQQTLIYAFRRQHADNKSSRTDTHDKWTNASKEGQNENSEGTQHSSSRPESWDDNGG